MQQAAPFVHIALARIQHTQHADVDGSGRIRNVRSEMENRMFEISTWLDMAKRFPLTLTAVPSNAEPSRLGHADIVN